MNKFKGKSKIIDNKYVIKNTNKDLRELYNYLNERNFDMHPYIYDINDKEIRTEYIEETNNIEYELALADVLSNLHYKTTKLKDVSKRKYKEIYDKLLSNISYLTLYYDEFIKKIEPKKYISPSEYLFERNFSLINYLLSYSKNTLDNWYQLVENKEKERVVIVHNNLKKSKVLRSDKNYLIGFDKYLVDTPVIDLYKLYINENDLDFKTFITEYNKNYSLNIEEQKLFLTLISIPKKIEFINNEILNIKNLKNILDYMYKTKKLIFDFEKEVAE